MADLATALQSLDDYTLPEGLHGRIMRRLWWLHLKTPFVAVLSLTVLNLLATGWSIWVRLTDLDAPELLRSMLTDFQLDYASVANVASLSVEFFPVRAMVAFAVNLTLVAYLIYLNFAFRRMSFIKGRTSS